jgi:Methyltransferase domain.
MTRLPFVAERFDAVVAFWSLIHVPLADHRTTVEEFARVLEPGGRVLLCEGPEEWVGENPDWLDSGVGVAWEVAGVEQTREQSQAAGFRVTESWGAAERLAGDTDVDASGDENADDPDRVFLAAELAP